jgi:hypothetical protein
MEGQCHLPRRSARRRARRIFWGVFWVLFWLCGLLLGALLGYLSFAGEGTVRRALIAYMKGETRPEVAFPAQDSVTVLVVGADENRDRRKRVVTPSPAPIPSWWHASTFATAVSTPFPSRAIPSCAFPDTAGAKSTPPMCWAVLPS